MNGLRPPSPELQRRVAGWIDARVVPDGPGFWPQRLMKERGVYLLHGNQAFLWYLSPEGTVLYTDQDRYGWALDPETDRAAAVNAVAQAARERPELRELLPERPAGAPDCPHCGGTGDESPWGRCVCAGLGFGPLTG